MKEETEFILQCNPTNSYIEQVLFSKLPAYSPVLHAQPLIFCLAPESLEAGKRFFDDIRLTGKAENFLLTIMLGENKHLFAFSGVQLRNHLLVVAQQTSETLPEETTQVTKALLAEEVNSALEMPEASEISETETDEREIKEVTVWDLMEEMSRLNNELINTKRELIRKNLELERLQQMQKKG